MKVDQDKMIKLLDGTEVPRFVIRQMRDAVRTVQADGANNMLAVLALRELAQHAADPTWEVAPGYQTYLGRFKLWPLSPDELMVLDNALDDTGQQVQWRNPVYTYGPFFQAEIVGLPTGAPLLPHQQATIRQMHRPGARRTKRRRRR